MKNVFPLPENAAIMATFQCTAECEECCFECSPRLHEKASFDEIKLFIDQISDIPSIKYLVFTGGECFINFSLLRDSIKYASSKNLPVRCVTNSFWATSPEIAMKKISELTKAGLQEINLSTGDDHQKFVSIDNVLYATYAGLENNLTVAISIETRKNTKFKKIDLVSHPFYIGKIQCHPRFNQLKILNAVWVSFHKENKYEYNEMRQPLDIDEGCDEVYKTISLSPTSEILGCCGLTVLHIPQFHLGKLDNNLWETYSQQYRDFLKIWIYVDGPRAIFDFARDHNPNIKDVHLAHKCLYCSLIFNNFEISNTLTNNYLEIKDSVLSRYRSKLELKNAIKLIDEE